MNSVDLPPLSSDLFYMYYVLLLQSCDLAFLPDELCGLAPTKFHSWSHVQTQLESLPACTTGDEQGEFNIIIMIILLI